MANKYSKALKHLKNKTIDEKLELLSEIPTNHTGGLYTDVPGVNEPPETVPKDQESGVLFLSLRRRRLLTHPPAQESRNRR